MHTYVTCTDGNLMVRLDLRTRVVTVTAHNYTNLPREFPFPDHRSVAEVRDKLVRYSSGIVDGTHRLNSYASVELFLAGLTDLLHIANRRERSFTFARDLMFTDLTIRPTPKVYIEPEERLRRQMFFPENFPKLVVHHDHTKPATQSLIDQLGD